MQVRVHIRPKLLPNWQGQTETRRKRTSLDMIQRAKPRAQLGSHLKNPMQQPNKTLKIANLAFGCKQYGLDGMQKFANLSLGKIKTASTKIYAPAYVFNFNTHLNFFPADRIPKNLAKAKEKAGIQGNRLQ